VIAVAIVVQQLVVFFPITTIREVKNICASPLMQVIIIQVRLLARRSDAILGVKALLASGFAPLTVKFAMERTLVHHDSHVPDQLRLLHIGLSKDILCCTTKHDPDESELLSLLAPAMVPFGSWDFPG
jgi:hypothetical protein